MKSIHGMGTALVTPFDSNNQIDFDSLANLLEHQISGGIDYVVTMGTTGESVTLTNDEFTKVVRFTVDQVKNRVPIVVGIGGNNTAAVARKLNDFDFNGIEAILSSSPAYNKPPQDGIIQHYEQLCQASAKPIIVYNVPGRTASNITAQTTLELAKIDGICGVKEASGDMVQGALIADQMPENFALISGDDPTAYYLRSIGGHGCISVLSNLLPDKFPLVVNYSNWEQMEEAKNVHLAYTPVHPWLYVDGNPAGIKAALHNAGICQKHVRLPLTPMKQDNEKKLLELLKKAQS